MKDLSQKFSMQDDEYVFPYHHIPHINAQGQPRIARAMGWGLEYLCYIHHVVSIVEALRPTSVLDAGCGDGRLLSLVPNVRRRLGIDLSTRAIRFAQGFSDAEFRVGNVSQVEERFSVATLIEVLEHIPDEAESDFLAAVGKCVAPGGSLIISVPSAVRPVHPKHYRHYTVEQLTATIATSLPNFAIESVDSIFRETWLSILYRRLFQNRFWQSEVPIISRIVWRQIWQNRVCVDGRGAHLIAVCRAP